VIAEGVAIVASILLAFAIDAAWDRRQLGVERAAILESLRGEFEIHRSELAHQLSQTESRSGWIADGLRVFDEGVTSDAGVAVVDSALFAVLYIGDWDPRGGFLASVIAAGRLDMLDDEQLRAELASWPGVVEDVVDNQSLMQTFGLTVVVPTLSRKGVPLGRSWALRRADWPDHGREPPGGISRVYHDISQDPEVRSLMATKHGFLSSSVGEIERAIAHVDRVLLLLAGELE
jgi:hypothetical protein